MGEQTAREAVDACTLVEGGGEEVSPGASRRGFLEEVNAALCVITEMEGGAHPCPAQVEEVGGDTETAEFHRAVFVHSSRGERSLLWEIVALHHQ